MQMFDEQRIIDSWEYAEVRCKPAILGPGQLCLTANKAFCGQRGGDYRNTEQSVANGIVMLDETFERCSVFKLTRRLIKRRGRQEDDTPF